MTLWLKTLHAVFLVYFLDNFIFERMKSIHAKYKIPKTEYESICGTGTLFGVFKATIIDIHCRTRGLQ